MYYVVYSELSKEKNFKNDINKFEVENELLNVIGKNELTALNKCIGRGNSFDSCFDENYKYFGEKTFKCITDPEYCKTMTDEHYCLYTPNRLTLSAKMTLSCW